jgi:2-polyprenyl-3-methyl-5-hydroxy-6-metoxy-1,4-benzoquinol methylase
MEKQNCYKLIKNYKYITENLSEDLAKFLMISQKELRTRLERNYYVSNWYAEFMDQNNGDYFLWLQKSKFYLYNSTEWHILVGIKSMCENHIFPSQENRECIDIGSGIGTHSIIDAILGWKITLCEVNEHSLRFSKYRFRKYELEGKFITEIPCDQKYYLVRLWDVVGHLLNPIENFEKILRLVSPEGGIIISFDNENISDFNRDWHKNNNISFRKILISNGFMQETEHFWRKHIER